MDEWLPGLILCWAPFLTLYEVNCWLTVDHQEATWMWNSSMLHWLSRRL